MHTTTLRTALETYRCRVSLQKKGSPQEKYRIGQLSRSWLGDKPIATITSVDIATYRDERLQLLNPRTGQPLSPATVRLELALLSNLFEIGRIEWGLCQHNPVALVRKPKVAPGRDRRLTPREERTLLNYCRAHANPELLSIVILAVETAMRQGEILKLQWQHLHLKARIAHLPDTKNGSKRDVPLSLRAREALVRLGMQASGPVFHYTANGLKSTWRCMTQRLGITDLHFHDLRHEAISRLFELGTLDLMEVAAISGHKSLAMLKRYTHLNVQRLVRKLEGGRNKTRQAILDHLLPYPALLEQQATHVEVRFLDFDQLMLRAPTRAAAQQAAQDLLLRHLITLLHQGQAIPAPDQYLEAVNTDSIEWVHPLGLIHAA